MDKTRQNILLILGAVALALIPLFMHSSPNPEGGEEIFTGSDSQAVGLIEEISPGYKPWFSSFWEPPSSEVESLLFALQAAIGSGLVFYYLGYHRGSKRRPA